MSLTYYPAQTSIAYPEGVAVASSQPPPITDPSAISGLHWWWDANLLSSLTLGGSDNISNWQARVEGAHQGNLSQSTSVERPGYWTVGGANNDTANKYAAMSNGTPYIAGHDSGDALFNASITAKTFVQFTWFFVLRLAGTPTATEHIYNARTAANLDGPNLRRHASQSDLYFYWSGPGTQARFSFGTISDAWQIVTVQGAPNQWKTDTSSMKAWINRTAMTLTVIQQPNQDMYREAGRVGVHRLVSGNSDTFDNGATAEIIMYDSIITDDQVRQVQNWLIAKHGTELAITPTAGTTHHGTPHAGRSSNLPEKAIL